MKIFMIPGLGFDHRIFRNLHLPDCQPVFLNWIDPLPEETLNGYAKRIAQLIPDNEPIILLGHSFGGILCQMISELKKVDAIFLISTIESRNELPLNLKIIAHLGLERVITRSLILRSFRFWGESYGYSDKEAQSLFKEMIKNNSKTYLKWALKTISEWEEPESSRNGAKVIRIHGALDKTFPIKRMNAVDYIIDGGHHFMVFQKAAKISEIIMKEIEFSEQMSESD